MSLGPQARLGASDLIKLSERATELSPGQWALAMLRRAFPEASEEMLLALPVGARDRLMLSIRGGLRPGPLRAEPVCNACGATYELTLKPEEIGLGGDVPWPEPGFRAVEVSGKNVLIRPVTLGDLLEAEVILEPGEAARLMASRVQDGASDLPPDALAGALETLDPGADVWVTAACPDCGAEQSVAFDAVYFVAHELRQLSGQVMQDVVDIARAFRWSEVDILALPDARRAYYLAEALA